MKEKVICFPVAASGQWVESSFVNVCGLTVCIPKALLNFFNPLFLLEFFFLLLYSVFSSACSASSAVDVKRPFNRGIGSNFFHLLRSNLHLYGGGSKTD
jgi:hypothetical protein